MERYTCPGCGKIVIIDGKRVLHEVPECSLFIRKVSEIIQDREPAIDLLDEVDGQRAQ